MKWNLRVPDSSELLYYFVKLTGLAPFTVKNNVLYAPNVFSRLYPLLVAASYLLFVSVSYVSLLPNLIENHSLFITMWVTSLYFSSLPSTILTLVVFLAMHEKIIHALNTLRTVSIELESLGIEEDRGKLFKKLFVTAVTAHTILVAALVILTLVQPDWPILYSIKYYLDSWFDLNTVLIFTQMLIWIREHFTLMNVKLYDILKPARRLGPSDHWRFTMIGISTEEACRPCSEDLTDLQRIRKIRDVHFELCDLVDRTTHLFNVPIIFTSIRYFTTLMTYCYWIYSTLRIPDHHCKDTTVVSLDIAKVLCYALRTGIAIGGLIMITHASATACEQGNAARAVLSRVWIKLSPGQLMNALYQFSHQLLRKPVTVSFLGFVNLDYSLIFKIFCIVATYLFVMVQIEPSLPC